MAEAVDSGTEVRHLYELTAGTTGGDARWARLLELLARSWRRQLIERARSDEESGTPAAGE